MAGGDESEDLASWPGKGTDGGGGGGVFAIEGFDPASIIDGGLLSMVDPWRRRLRPCQQRQSLHDRYSRPPR